MTNTTHFIDFQARRALMSESYHELGQFFTFPPEIVKILNIIILVVTGWIVSVTSVLLLSPFLPLTSRKPNRDIFFAAYNEKIRKDFLHQTEETFQTILMGTNRVLQANTEDPTVFLILVPEGAMPTAVRLVTLLIHCILVACQLPASEYHIKQVITDGTNYSSHDDEWPLFKQIKRQLMFYGVAAVFSFDRLHPQAVRTLKVLLPQVRSPIPESVLIMVVDLRSRYTEHEKNNLSSNSLGKKFLQDHFGPYFDRSELSETIKRLGSRCILINPELDIS